MKPETDMQGAAKRGWWWKALRAPFEETEDERLFCYHVMGWDESAFLYEFSARVKGRFEFKKDWSQITQAQVEKLAQRWPMPERSPCIFRTAGPAISRPVSLNGWTDYANNSYNLAVQDMTLMRFFHRWLQAERKRTGIPNPRPNAGKKNRNSSSPLNWRIIELMDIRKSRALNDSERSQVSKAVRLYTPRLKIGLD